jgi:serine/threonine protein kinase
LPRRSADRERLNLYSEFASNDLKSVGNYTLGRLIGKGSFGKVYLATHKLTNGSKVSAYFIGGCNMPILANHATSGRVEVGKPNRL